MNGEEMTAEILAAAAPIVHGQPSKLVIEVMAAVALATVQLGCQTDADRITVLRRFAMAINTLADCMS
jgi:hypothetical protein